MASNFNLVAENERIWNSDYSVSVVSRLSYQQNMPICRNTQRLRLRNLGKNISCPSNQEPNWELLDKERFKIITDQKGIRNCQCTDMFTTIQIITSMIVPLLLMKILTLKATKPTFLPLFLQINQRELSVHTRVVRSLVRKTLTLLVLIFEKNK